jgi:hypothetical protein
MIITKYKDSCIAITIDSYFRTVIGITPMINVLFWPKILCEL